MDKFGKHQYLEAKEYFKSVDSTNENYEEALNMIKHCEEEIDNEGITNSK